MMINNKTCNLIVLLLVLVILPRSSKSFFSRLNKRSTDNVACEQSTAVFCSKMIFDEKGLMERFSPDTFKQIQNNFENATTNCKVLLCVMTMYVVLMEGEKYFPNSSFITDDAFVNVIKGSNLLECNDNKNNQNNDSQSGVINIYNIYNSTTVDYDKSYTTDSTVDFNHLETTSPQQDTQSIKPNEIDGSLNESKHEPRKGIIDILYTNENYTDAAKSKDMNEQSDTKLVKDNTGQENVSFVNMDKVDTRIDESTPTPPFIDYSDDDRPSGSHMDVANRVLDVTRRTSYSHADKTPNLELVYVSSISTAPTDSPEVTEFTSTEVLPNLKSTKYSTSLSDAEEGDDANPATDTTSQSDSPSLQKTTTKSALSQVGNIIFQLLGEEGYNSFLCNLTTVSEDDTLNIDEDNMMYRRLNKVNSTIQAHKTIDDVTFEKVEFKPADNNSLPNIPQSLNDDQNVKFLLLKFNVFEACNFTSNNDQNSTENISRKLTLCSDAIATAKLHLDGKAKIILEKYYQDVKIAAKKFKVIQESPMKIIKIINLTDYLSSTIKESEIPKNLKNDFHKLKQFLLVELKNEDLSLFHPDSNRKDAFMVQLFDYLIQSKVVDNKKKKLLEMFKKFIRSTS